jgi:hypothetical protein
MWFPILTPCHDLVLCLLYSSQDTNFNMRFLFNNSYPNTCNFDVKIFSGYDAAPLGSPLRIPKIRHLAMLDPLSKGNLTLHNHAEGLAKP